MEPSRHPQELRFAPIVFTDGLPEWLRTDATQSYISTGARKRLVRRPA